MPKGRLCSRCLLVVVWLMLPCALAGCGSNSKKGPAGGKTAPYSNELKPGQCRSEPSEHPEQLKIAVIPKGTTHEFWKAIHAGAIKAELELRGVTVIWKGPTKEDDRSEQINVVENFITAHVDGVALAPLDNVALVKPVREAVKSGVAVVIMDSALDAEPCKDYASFVATDNYLGGQKGAQQLGKLLERKGQVLMMRYQVGSASTMEREQGFLDALTQEFPDIQLVSQDQYGGATTESAYAKAENLLNRFPDVGGIFCPNESTTFGMLRALQESGRAGKVKFVGFDSSQKLIEAMVAGHIHGLVLQDPLNMGYLAVTKLVAYLRGETVETRIDTGSTVATPANMLQPRIQLLLDPPIDKYLK